MSSYHIVASTEESTVVAEYAAEYRVAREYQSEADLEREFIRLLSGQGYEYLAISNETALLVNLRRQLEILNGFTFSDDEWARFFGECIASSNEGIVEKTRKIQDDHVQVLKRDDGSTKNVYLLDKKNINDDIIFELELIKQIEVNIDYILVLVEKYHALGCEDKSILAAIDKAVNSSIELRSKKELIEHFVEQVNTSTNVDDDWRRFVQERKEKDLSTLIAAEKLKDEETRRFMDIAFRDGTLKTTGTDIDKILPPVSRFGGGKRTVQKQSIIEKLMKFFEKYLGLV